MIRLAVVSPASAGPDYAQSIQAVQGAELAACIQAPEVPAAPELTSVPRFESLERALADASLSIDAVVFHQATPQAQREALAAAKRGKHICTGPALASSLGQAEQLVRICRANGVTLMVGNTLRFEGAHRQAKQLCLQGKIGAPGLVRLHHWAAAPASNDAGPHCDFVRMAAELDLVLWIFAAAPTHVVGHRVCPRSRNSNSGRAAVADTIQVGSESEKGAIVPAAVAGVDDRVGPGRDSAHPARNVNAGATGALQPGKRQARSAAASSVGPPAAAPVTTLVHLGFHDGGMAIVDRTSLTGPHRYWSFSIIGQSGAIYVDDQHNSHLLIAEESCFQIRADTYRTALATQLRSFVSAVRQRTTPELSADEGLAALRVAQAAADSCIAANVATGDFQPPDRRI